MDTLDEAVSRSRKTLGHAQWTVEAFISACPLVAVTLPELKHDDAWKCVCRPRLAWDPLGRLVPRQPSIDRVGRDIGITSTTPS